MIVYVEYQVRLTGLQVAKEADVDRFRKELELFVAQQAPKMLKGRYELVEDVEVEITVQGGQ